jgi:hypothetical protein
MKFYVFFADNTAAIIGGSVAAGIAVLLTIIIAIVIRYNE